MLIKNRKPVDYIFINHIIFIKRMRIKYSALLIMGLFFVVIGCKSIKKSNESSNKMSLFGTKWVLVELNGQKAKAQNENDEPFFFIIDQNDQQINGFSGCNKFFGAIELQEEKQSIQFSQIGSTKMACQNMDEEMNFLTMLDKVMSYAIDGSSLSLKDEEDKVIASFQVGNN